MSNQISSNEHRLGEMTARFENNPAYAKDLLGFIVLFVIAGIIALAIGIAQDLPRDQLPIIGGSLLLLAIGARLYFAYRGRLNVSATVYENGFVLVNRQRQPVTCLWEDITEVYETIIYRDQRMRYPRWWRYTVHRRDGKTTKLDDAILQVQGLGSLIQQATKEQMLPQAIKSYEAGETVSFGPKIGLIQQGLIHQGRLLPWEEVAEITFSRNGSLQINRKNHRGVWRTIQPQKIANHPTFRSMITQTIKPAQTSTTPDASESDQEATQLPGGVSPSSIGGISLRLGYDVRELMMAGYTLQEIQGVLQGKYTLEALLKKKPGRAAQRKR